MTCPRHKLFTVILMNAVLLLVSGCGPDRKAQCRELAIATNTVIGNVEAVHTSQIGGNAYDPAYERKLAEAWESGVDVVQAVELSDNQLDTTRNELVSAYQQAAAMRRQAAELIPESGRLDAETEAQVDALQLQSEEKIPPAINDLNLYCMGG